jgi:hypothetical protein
MSGRDVSRWQVSISQELEWLVSGSEEMDDRCLAGSEALGWPASSKEELGG